MKAMSVSVTLLLSASAGLAQWSEPPSSSDALDVSNGTVLTASTPGIAPGPEAIFGADLGGPEPGTCFFPDIGLGGVGFVEVRTTSPAALTGVRLYAKNDGTLNFNRRAMRAFRVFADTDNNGTFETQVVNVAIDVSYTNEPNNLATQPEFLELAFSFASTTAAAWRFEFEQGVLIPPFEGMRVIEVDGFAAACYADCDTSTGVGVLDIFDFLCFGNRFSAGDPYACDCDVSTGPGVCDIFDFLCFGNAFNAGCP